MFYLFPEDDLGPIPTEEELGKSTDANGSWMQIERWFENCAKHHPGCQRRTESTVFVPTRLIDINSPYEGYIRVIETRPSKVKGPYVTLSHCWGLTPFIQLNSAEKEWLMTKGVKQNDLPKNFQEAIKVAQHLHMRYIWIDSLCIIQDSKDDWHCESSLMHQVYRNSYCNIAAAASSDSSGGLFRERNPKDILPARWKADGRSQIFKDKVWRIVPKNLWDQGLLQSVLYRRGWVFQGDIVQNLGSGLQLMGCTERMLSPRLLHFAKNQVFWDCVGMSACEILPAGIPQPLGITAGNDRHWRKRLQETALLRYSPLAGSADLSLESFWKIAVRNYTSCALTIGSDKMKALWGITKLVGDEMQERNGVGLWELNLEEQLAWRVVACQQANGKHSQRPRPLRAPSWTWISMDGVIEVQDRLSPERDYKIQDHEGRALALEFEGESQDESVRPRTWNAQFQLWDEKLKRKEHKRRTKGPQKARGSTQIDNTESPGDAPPELRCYSLPIQGHIGRSCIRRSCVAENWTLGIPGLDIETEAFEVFPDMDPGSGVHECLFLILALGRTDLASGDAWAEQLSESEDEIPAIYSGIGLILEPTDQKNHFYRCGSMHISNLDETALKAVEATYIKDSSFSAEYGENGHIFWLD